MADQAKTPSATGGDTPAGFAFAIAAYVYWGFMPLYLKLLAHIPPVEIVAHRIVWSVPVAAALVIVLGRSRDLRVALRTPSMLAMGAVTAALISVNWAIYTWAVASGQAIEAALGYYINPLFSVFLGAVFLGERLTRMQVAAIGLAVLAVAILTVEAGTLPWAAVGLTLSWGFYAFFKKSLPIGPNQGFLLEVLILLVPASVFLLSRAAAGQGAFGGSVSDTALLAGSGLVTAIPLILFGNGAKLLRLSTMGILQYIAPTLIFLVAVFVFGEPFGGAKLVAVPLIWAALVLYSVSLVREARRRRVS